MPKSQNINPKVVRKPKFIEFGKIPVNQYNKTIEEEKKNFTNDDFIRIYHDMVVIREFETMLNLIKTTNEYNGIPYNHPGPAHLSIGQEASAVGWPIILMLMIIFSDRTAVMARFWPKDFLQFTSLMKIPFIQYHEKLFRRISSEGCRKRISGNC